MICNLCPHNCNLKEGEVGICGARKNVGGEAVNLTYGKVSVVAVESIKKRPIFHYKPDSMLLSLGSVGCNLKCAYCQNHEISQISAEKYEHFAVLPPERVADMVRGYDGVAFTYNEPLINYEYVLATAKLVKAQNKITAVSTNGFVNRWVLEELAPHIDAWNVDVKAFSDEFYRRYTGGWLEPVKRTVEILVSEGRHVEITYLVIPGLNDSEEEIRAFAGWVADLNEDIPVHLPRFYPHYQMLDRAPTPLDRISAVAQILKEEGLHHIHGGWEEYFGVWKMEEVAGWQRR